MSNVITFEEFSIARAAKLAQATSAARDVRQLQIRADIGHSVRAALERARRELEALRTPEVRALEAYRQAKVIRLAVEWNGEVSV